MAERRGRPAVDPSERKSNKVNLRLPDHLYAQVEAGAEESGESISGEIQRRLAEYERLALHFDMIASDRPLIHAFGEIANIKSSLTKMVEDIGLSGREAQMASAYLFAVALSALNLDVVEALKVEIRSGLDETGADNLERRLQHLALRYSGLVEKSAGLAIWSGFFPPGTDTDYGRGLMYLGSTAPKPPENFVPPPPTDEQITALMEKAEKSGLLNWAAKAVEAEGLYPEASIDEIKSMLREGKIGYPENVTKDET